LESKISGTMSFAQWWVLDLTSETLSSVLAPPHAWPSLGLAGTVRLTLVLRTVFREIV